MHSDSHRWMPIENIDLLTTDFTDMNFFHRATDAYVLKERYNTIFKFLFSTFGLHFYPVELY